MPTIKFFTTAAVFDFRKSDEGDFIDDKLILKTLDGLEYSDESFSDYLLDGSETRELADIGITGGDLKFKFYPIAGLMVHTEYLIPRLLTEPEISKLRHYTIGQWSDGIGSNFFQERISEGLAPQALVSDEMSVEFEQRA